YPNINKLSNVKQEKEYIALYLENKYIKICVLPELGGRLYTAVDKSNGYDFIYRNNVIKPSLIGMTGAWISGGVEWNIPHHHRASTFMPVDYKIVENADSSKTIWVGEYEKRSQTRWCVGMTLYPDKSYVECSIKVLNVTPIANNFLVWANTAVASNKDYQVIFPPDVERATYHTKSEFTDYPISHQIYQGIDFRNTDISWWKNTFSPTSFFAWDSKQDFMAGIDHGRNTGTVVVGDHHIFTGKKFWNWGNNEVQRLWDQMLTDKDGPYLELMMGMYSDNQPDYSWNSPFDGKDGKMYYYPVKGLNSIKEASKDIALNVELKTGKAIIQIVSTSNMNNCTLSLSNVGTEILSEKVNLDPTKTFVREIKVPTNLKEEDLAVSLKLADNKQIISYIQPKKKNDPEPEKYVHPSNPSQLNNADELYQAGLRLEQFANAIYEPLKYYNEALKRDPNHILTNTKLGEYYLKIGKNEQAKTYLETAVKAQTKKYTAPKNGEAVYYLGLTLFYQEKYTEAYDMLYKATWNAEFASQSFYLLAVIDCLNGDYSKAFDELNVSISRNSNNVEALSLLAIIQRNQGNLAEASKILKVIEQIDPLSQTAAFEKYLSEKKSNSAEAIKKLINFLRDEPDSYLETASRYIMAGFYKDAQELLQVASNSVNKTSSAYPLTYYYLGYCNSKTGNAGNATSNYAKASKQNLNYCFPFGMWSAKVLKDAIKSNPNDATAHYLLGNLECDNDPQLAYIEWTKSAELKPAAMTFRNLAFLDGNQFDNPDKAMQNMQKAIDLDSTNPFFLLEYDQYAEYKGVNPNERLQFLEKNHDLTTSWDKTNLVRVELLTFTGQYDKAIEILKNQHFFIAERTALNPHASWTNVLLGRGIQYLKNNQPDKAIADFSEIFRFPRNLEISRDSKIVIANYWLAKAYQMKVNKKEAIKYLNLMANDNQTYTGWGAKQNPLIYYFKGLALNELGKKQEATELFNKMIETGNNQVNMIYHEALQDKSVKIQQAHKLTKAEGYLYLALANVGLGNGLKAKEFNTKALEIVPGLYDVKTCESAI
ncbi:MAG: DUF5107 domain-containing protein, partial [Bacteroidota bacterium]